MYFHTNLFYEKLLYMQIAPILGGMSADKQKRILKKCPDILVATPGRLWELMSQVNKCSVVHVLTYLVFVRIQSQSQIITPDFEKSLKLIEQSNYLQFLQYQNSERAFHKLYKIFLNARLDEFYLLINLFEKLKINRKLVVDFGIINLCRVMFELMRSSVSLLSKKIK